MTFKIISKLPASTKTEPDHVEVSYSKDGYWWALFDGNDYQIGDAQYLGYRTQSSAVAAASEFARSHGVSKVRVYKRDGEVKKTIKVAS